MGDITHFFDDVTRFTKWNGTGTWNHALRVLDVHSSRVLGLACEVALGDLRGRVR